MASPDHGVAPVALTLALCALGLSGLGGCGLGFMDVKEPESARVRLDGETDTGRVRLVTSTDFQVAQTRSGDRDPRLLTSDTSLVDVPFDRTFPIGSTQRFFVEAGSPDSTAATISMRVSIDGREHYSASRTVTDETLAFLFVSREF